MQGTQQVLEQMLEGTGGAPELGDGEVVDAYLALVRDGLGRMPARAAGRTRVRGGGPPEAGPQRASGEDHR